MLQDTRDIEAVRRGLRHYFPVRLAQDSAFPFGAQDRVVTRTVHHEAVVLTPVDTGLDGMTIEVPPVDAELREDLPAAILDGATDGDEGVSD